MSGAIQTLYVPCEVLHVRAIIAPAKSPMPIEQLVLEAIAKRSQAPTLDELTRMFGIGTRPMLDLVRPMWYRGLVFVDPDTGTIALTASTKKEIERNGAAEIAEGSWSEERVTVLRELLTGHILRPVRYAGQRPGFTIPEEVAPSGGHLSGGEYAELVDVVQRLLRKTFAEREKTLISAIPIPVESTVSPERRTVRLRALVSKESDIDVTRFNVVEPRRLAARIRADLGRGLTRSADSNPDLLVYKNIRRRIVADVETELEPLERSIVRLSELCAENAYVLNEDVVAHHAECVSASEEVN